MAIVSRKLSLEKDNIAGYLAYPERAGRGAAILIIHHNHGISGELVIEAYDWAERGYAVFIPDMFEMCGFPGPFLPGAGAPIQKKVTDPQFVAAINRGWDFLLARPDVDPGRCGVLGYCLGGRLGVHFVAATSAVRCFATFYPSIKEEPETELRPVHAFKAVGRITCPTFVVFGGDDRIVPNDMQLKILKQLIDNGVALEWHFYSHGEHGFRAVPSGGYQPELVRRTSPLTHGFFERELASAAGVAGSSSTGE